MYEVYLDGVLLPITPEEINREIQNRNEEVVLINGATKNITKIAGLTTFTFEFYAPVQRPTSKQDYSLSNMPASEIEKLIDHWKKPEFSIINLTIKRDSKTCITSTDVSLETCIIRESRSHNGLVLFEMTLKEAPKYKTELINIEKQEDGEYKAITETKRERADNREIPDTVTVQRGDTLWAIAKKYLNNGEKWRELQKINNISNPNRLQIGQIIKLR